MLIVYLALVISGGLIFHIVAGYPLYLALRRGAVRRPVAKDPDFRTTVSVIVAVHNGEALIRKKLNTLLGLDYPPELVDIIVVSDGSTDSTEAIVREFNSRRVTLLTVRHGGKAAALNYGLTAA